MMKTVITGVLAAVLAGALGFWGGVTYQKAQTPTLSAAGTGGNGSFQPPAGFDPSQMPNGGQGGQAGQNGARRFAGGVATGTVLSADSKTITIKVASGGSKTVYLSADTRISEQQTLATSDIKVGDNIAAMGQSSNGGITARSVQIVPEGSDFRPGF
jgi:ABC-type transport system substrate-binding protein